MRLSRGEWGGSGASDQLYTHTHTHTSPSTHSCSPRGVEALSILGLGSLPIFEGREGKGRGISWTELGLPPPSPPSERERKWERKRTGGGGARSAEVG